MVIALETIPQKTLDHWFCGRHIKIQDKSKSIMCIYIFTCADEKTSLIRRNSTYDVHENLHKANMVHDNHSRVPRSFRLQPQRLWPDSPREGPQILVLVQCFSVVIPGDPQGLSCLCDPHELLHRGYGELHDHRLVGFCGKRN